MPKPVQITTPRPSFEEMTRHLRISKARRRELGALAEKGFRQIRKAEQEADANSVVERKEKRRNASAA